VRQLWSTLDALWNARDAQRFSDLFTDDGSLEFVDRGQAMEGRPAIRRYFAKQFSSSAPELRHVTSIRDVRVIAPDVRAVDGRVEILRQEPGKNVAPTVLRTFAIVAVMVRTEEVWRIRVLRAYLLPAAAIPDERSGSTLHAGSGIAMAGGSYLVRR
jgi:uncharacterized protein (TIGR02246 family)